MEGDIHASLATAADGSGDNIVVWKGQDGNLWYALYDPAAPAGSQWSTAASLGMGPLGSEPTIALGPVAGSGITGVQNVYIFWQGADNNLWSLQGTLTGEGSTAAVGASGFHLTVTATSPTVVPGMGPLGSRPAATFIAGAALGGVATDSVANSVDVFWKGTDGNLWDVDIPVVTTAGTTYGMLGTPPTSPAVIPGMATLGSAPSVGSDRNGSVFVFWQGSGSNTAVWEAWDNYAAGSPAGTGAWSGPLYLGAVPYEGGTGNTGSGPSVGVSPAGQQVIFWQGQDGNLYYAVWNGASDQPNSGGAWVGYTLVPGMAPLNSEPAVAFNGTSLTVFWKGTDLNIWNAHTTVTLGAVPTSGSTWVGPTSVGDGPIDGV